MPHFVLEYSSNLDGEIDVQDIFHTLRATALETGIFPLGGIRFRARRCEEYLVADGDSENAFVHLTLKVGHGRTLAVRKTAGETLFAALSRSLAAIFASRPLAISFEMTELHETLNFKQNNIHERMGGKRTLAS